MTGGIQFPSLTRVMTDFSAERYWTIVSEMEVPSMQAFEAFGRREIYKIEG